MDILFNGSDESFFQLFEDLEYGRWYFEVKPGKHGWTNATGVASSKEEAERWVDESNP